MSFISCNGEVCLTRIITDNSSNGISRRSLEDRVYGRTSETDFPIGNRDSFIESFLFTRNIITESKISSRWVLIESRKKDIDTIRISRSNGLRSSRSGSAEYSESEIDWPNEN